MGIQKRLKIASEWTDDELWEQFELNLFEYRPETGMDADTAYNAWMRQYAAIRAECGRRKLLPEWERRMEEWRIKKRGTICQK